MANETTKQLEEYKKSLRNEADEIITEVFPKKVHELNKLIENGKFSLSRVREIREAAILPDPPPEDEKEEERNGVKDGLSPILHGLIFYDRPLEKFRQRTKVTTNPHIEELYRIFRQQLYDIVNLSSKVKTGISLCVPRMEDGNNFGVEVQEELKFRVKTLCSDYQSATSDILDAYHRKRGEAVMDILRYSHIEDYRLQLQDMDERSLVVLHWAVVEMRNEYLTMHDQLMKNIEKVKNPKSLEDVDQLTDTLQMSYIG